MKISMQASYILELLLQVASKASQIATVIRKEKALLDLLIEEKPEIKKNHTFVQDFKTLADVLIQETVRHFISEKIPELKDSIYGEESNTFTNTNGESIVVQVCNTQVETKELLKNVLDNNNEAAHLLAETIHGTANPSDVTPCEGIEVDVDTHDSGVWIDPIDATGQYIKGIQGVEDEHGMVDDGLQCVAILIGLFQKSTGKPLMGVVVQPFAKWNPATECWRSNTIWGFCHKNVQATSLHKTLDPNCSMPARIVMSKSESKQVQQAISSKYTVVTASGAGYKIILTALNVVSAYVLSHRSIYRWDCCAVHAILNALGGGIVSYTHAREAAAAKQGGMLNDDDITSLQINYVKSEGAIASRRSSLSGERESLPGVIAYRSKDDLIAILDIIK